MPGVGALHDPSAVGLQWGAFGTDDPATSEHGQQLTSASRVVSGIQVCGDLFRSVEPESGEARLQGVLQQGSVFLIDIGLELEFNRGTVSGI